jgi:uncharacterized cupin superfamily protein
MRIRRVVTGHTPDGRSIIASDMLVEGITAAISPGAECHRLWGADQTPMLTNDGSPPPARNYFPPPGGFRFGLFSIPPNYLVPPDNLDWEAAQREAEVKFPGMGTAHWDANQPGMHTTDTIDFEYVISGEVFLVLEDGSEVHLRPGDTVVQNGTRHAWDNRGNETCRMVTCMIGAYRK